MKLSKKVLSIFVCLLLIFGFNFAVSAGTVTTNNGTDSATAKATYVPAPDTYKVDITWGALTYTYTQTWNTSTRTNTYTWASTAAGTADKITVANSSNVNITAEFAWTADTTITGVVGTFSSASFDVNKVATEGAAAPTKNTTLTLSGTPNSTSLDNTTVGTVTVTIKKKT